MLLLVVLLIAACGGAATPGAEPTRPTFAATRAMLQALRQRFSEQPFDMLSMGMTNDFEVAIEEGATHVRVGTALFGPREYD